jgi:hypothetical protein
MELPGAAEQTIGNLRQSRSNINSLHEDGGCWGSVSFGLGLSAKTVLTHPHPQCCGSASKKCGCGCGSRKKY